MFMRENSRFEMMRAVGAQAVDVCGERGDGRWQCTADDGSGRTECREISEGETSGDDFSDGDYTNIDE